MSEAPHLLGVDALDPLGDHGVLATGALWVEFGCRPLLAATGVLTVERGGTTLLEPLPPTVLARQLSAVTAHARPRLTLVGVLAGLEQVERVGDWLHEGRGGEVVLAPSPSVAGTPLLDAHEIDAVRRRLFPQARVVVVRAGDVGRLLGRDPGGWDRARDIASALRDLGARAVLIAGVRSGDRVIDVLDDEGRFGLFDAPRLAAPPVSGLGAAHAAALAARLGLGVPLATAVHAAQRYVASRLDGGR